MKNHLRDYKNLNEIENTTDFNKEKIKNKAHHPNAIMNEIFKKNKELYDLKLISGELYITIDNETKIFNEIIGACERIKKTPIPYSYNIFIKKFIFVTH